jgi:predicted metal-dependent phosphoesterase TrpH
MPYVDLHLHTNYSDGSDTPRTVVERAAAMGIAAIAITDHDTLGGVGDGREHAARLGLGFLSGVEVSADFQKQETHVLAYGVDIEDSDLLALLEENVTAREKRSDEMLSRLTELGVQISLERLPAGAAPGRMHLALAMRDQGVTKTVQEGFDRYLKYGRPAYVPRRNVLIEDAIAAIHTAGGLAFLAHPGLNEGLRKRLPALFGLPFDGIEAFHSKHSPGDVEGFLQLARERNFLVSGGSDCHGSMKGAPEMGRVQTPYEYFEKIQTALRV